MSKRVLAFRNEEPVILDTETGDLSPVPKNKRLALLELPVEKRRKEFVVSEQGELLRLAACNMGGRSWQLLVYLLSILEYENWLTINNRIVGEHLGTSQQHVSVLLKGLRNRGLLIRQIGRAGQSRYRLAPDIAWKGSIESLRKTIKETLTGTVSSK